MVVSNFIVEWTNTSVFTTTNGRIRNTIIKHQENYFSTNKMLHEINLDFNQNPALILGSIIFHSIRILMFWVRIIAYIGWQAGERPTFHEIVLPKIKLNL